MAVDFGVSMSSVCFALFKALMMGPEAPEAVDSVRENFDIIMGTVESLHFDVLADQKDKEAFMARKKDMESFCQCASKALRSRCVLKNFGVKRCRNCSKRPGTGRWRSCWAGSPTRVQCTQASGTAAR